MSERKIKRERSAVVQRSIMSKAYKVSESEVNEKRNHFSPTNHRQVKPLTIAVGLGRRRSAHDDEIRSDLPTRSICKSISTGSAITSNLRGVSSPEALDDPYEENEESDFVNENRFLQSPRNENQVIDPNENLENENITKTAAPTSPTFNDDTETIIDKAADVADKSLLYLDAQLQKAVLRVSSILNKKD